MENKPTLETCNFQFTQEANCNSDRDTTEQIDIEYNSSLGLNRDGEGYFVIKTEGWSIDSVAELELLFERIKSVMK